METNETTFYHSTLWTENNLLCIKLAEDLIIDLELAKQMVLDCKINFGAAPKSILIDVTNLLSIDKEAREFFASVEALEYLISVAIYTDNILLSTIGNAWLTLNKPAIPIRIFSSKDEATKWLSEAKEITQR